MADTLKTPPGPNIKDVLGPGWMKELAQESGVKDSATLSRLVNYEITTSKHWPAVERVARKRNPIGFAEWEAAHAQAA